MSERNVATVIRYFEAFNKRDWATIEAMFPDDYVAYDGALCMRTKGREEHLRYVKSFVEAVPDIQCSDIHVIDGGGNLVINIFTWSGTDNGSGLLPSLAASGKVFVGSRVCELRYLDEQGRFQADEGYYDWLQPLVNLGHVRLPGSEHLFGDAMQVGPVVERLKKDKRAWDSADSSRPAPVALGGV